MISTVVIAANDTHAAWQVTLGMGAVVLAAPPALRGSGGP